MKKNRLLVYVLILLAFVAAYLVTTKKSGTIKEELKDFAVEDTASINKIFLADKAGHEVTLVRKPNEGWLLNGTEPVRADAINTLLYTIKNVDVRSPAGKAAYNNIMKTIAASGVKIEIYQNDKLTKTYYVGGPTQDHLGTFMYLENSSVPFVTHIPGFDGYLTTRYITNPVDWKGKTVFNYSAGSISSLRMMNNDLPEQSFTLTKAEETYDLANISGKKIRDADQGKIKAYLSGYSKISFEYYDSNIDPMRKDSVLNAGPFRIIEVTGKDGKKQTLQAYRKPVPENTSYPVEEGMPEKKFDIDRFYGVLSSDTGLIVLQYYVMGKIFKDADDLRR